MSEEYLYIFFLSILVFGWIKGSRLSEISMALIFSTLVIILSSPSLAASDNTEPFETQATTQTSLLTEEDNSQFDGTNSDPELIVSDYAAFRDPIGLEYYSSKKIFHSGLLFYVSSFNKSKTDDFKRTYNALDYSPIASMFMMNNHEKIASNFSQRNGFKVHTDELILPQASDIFNYDNRQNSYEDFSVFFIMKIDKDFLSNISKDYGSMSLLRIKANNSHMHDNMFLEIVLSFGNSTTSPSILVQLVKKNIIINRFTESLTDGEYHSLLFSKKDNRFISMIDNSIISDVSINMNSDISSGLGDNDAIAYPSTQDRSFIINCKPSTYNFNKIPIYMMAFGLYPRKGITNTLINTELINYHRSIHRNMDPIVVRLSGEISLKNKSSECPYDTNTCYSSECSMVSDWNIPSTAIAQNHELCFRKIMNHCENKTTMECMDYKKQNLMDTIKIADPSAAAILSELGKAKNANPISAINPIIKDKSVMSNPEVDKSYIALFNGFMNSLHNKDEGPAIESTPLYPEIDINALVSGIETFTTEEEAEEGDDEPKDNYANITLTDPQKRAVHRIIMDQYVEKQL